jgi:aromatic-amino-acid transaminase
MTQSMAATHSFGKFATDKIFGAASAANAAKAKFGKENVVDATIGVLLDETEALVCLPTVEKAFRALPMPEVCAYAPIEGLGDFLNAVLVEAFADNKPDAYIKAVATSGGSGAIHHTIYNYSEFGDAVLTSDWFWGPYRVLADGLVRKLETYTLYNEANKFNVKSFEAKVNELLAKQKSLVILLNTPAHNPTGYSLDNSEWDQVLDVLKVSAKNPDKKITLFVDIAYIDYAGERNASRSFMSKFTGLPANLLVVVGYSMSKAYTVYGQRTGAMIGISSSEDVATEFMNINQYLSRATWSNINRGAQRMLANMSNDKNLYAELLQERDQYYKLIQQRAAAFTAEARAVNLKMLPFIAGFFLSVPAQNTDAICNYLHKDNIFAVPLAKGVRVAVCAVPVAKIKKIPGKLAEAIVAVDK